ncbi:hypothetical protein BCR39DRAFT_521359 [Naematelia encephala]|uniref:Uncharacterized protein n=1 Tax=Naematelia encephala TaxID=71784 RepID=A0A1Y2BE58_9TREE|nr:hypothetical protein BCR39DRAFT_521359 [Naematelia encephala]
MKLVIVSLALAALVSAQNSTLIPSNITSPCSAFLDSLNSDSTLSTCVQPLINATSSFSPVAGLNLSSSDIDWTLASLCKSTSGCSDSTIRTWLSKFYAACPTELASVDGYNADVRELYDILYVVNPLKQAVCAIDSANQDYCVNQILASNSTASSSSTSASASASASAGNSSFVSLAAAFDPVAFAADNLYIAITSKASQLSKRMLNLLSPRQSTTQQTAFATIITPNTTTYRSTNLAFLFLQPDMASSALCTPCTREIMVAYIKWESTMPYALGLSSSPILGGQSKLWSAINDTCTTSYVGAITSEAGTFVSSANSTSGAASRFATVEGGQALATAAVGVAFVAGAMALFA